MTNNEKIEMIRRINCLSTVRVREIFQNDHIVDKFNDAANGFKFVMSLDNENLNTLFNYLSDCKNYN